MNKFLISSESLTLVNSIIINSSTNKVAKKIKEVYCLFHSKDLNEDEK